MLPYSEIHFNDENRSDPNTAELLGYGAEGEKVLQLQQKLNEIGQGYPAIPLLREDGKFGPKTLNSLLLFQHYFDLAVDGIAGPETEKRLHQVQSYIDELQ